MVVHAFKRPRSPSFVQKGLKGYHFPTLNKKVEVYFVNVTKGHEAFFISKKITHIYYVLDGKGHFTIKDHLHHVHPGMLVEVPPNIEYSYTGNMRLVLIMTPPWFPGNEKVTRKNPDVP